MSKNNVALSAKVIALFNKASKAGDSGRDASQRAIIALIKATPGLSDAKRVAILEDAGITRWDDPTKVYSRPTINNVVHAMKAAGENATDAEILAALQDRYAAQADARAKAREAKSGEGEGEGELTEAADASQAVAAEDDLASVAKTILASHKRMVALIRIMGAVDAKSALIRGGFSEAQADAEIAASIKSAKKTALAA